jgi:hypothetical protein
MIGCLAVAAALSAGLANAQNTKGNFTLPFEARWGLATLPAGDYSFKLDHATVDGTLQLYRGTKAVALIKSQGCNPNNDRTGGSELVVTRDKAGSGPVVTALRLASSGVVFSYAPHKPKHGTAPEEREIAQIIPVGAASESGACGCIGGADAPATGSRFRRASPFPRNRGASAAFAWSGRA